MTKMKTPLTKLAAAVLATTLHLSAIAEPVDVNSIDVYPVRVEIPPGKRVARVQIANRSARQVAYEVHAETHDGVQASDVLASPPVLQLAPGQTGTVKVGVPTPARADAERYARLVLTDISPAPAGAGDRAPAQLSLSLPIMVGTGRPILSIERAAGGYRVANTGTATAKIIRVAGTRTVEYVPPGAATVLPLEAGQKVEFDKLPELVAK